MNWKLFLFLYGMQCMYAFDSFKKDVYDGEEINSFFHSFLTHDKNSSMSNEETIRRHSRAIVFPDSGVYKFIIGLGLPIILPNKTIGLGINFQFQYGVPTSALQLAYPVVAAKRGDRQNRAAVYGAMEAALDRNGLPGRACVLRSVCEAAETPLLREGLLGEVLHLLLTPSLGHAAAEPLAEYVAAEAAGATGQDCAVRFSTCPPGHGLLDRISCLRHEDSSHEDEQDDWRRPPPHWDLLSPKADHQ